MHRCTHDPQRPLVLAAFAIVVIALGWSSHVRGDVFFVSEFEGGVYIPGAIAKIQPNGMVSQFVPGLDKPEGVAFDGSGNLYVALQTSSAIDRITPDGAISTFVSGLPGTLAGLAFDQSGNLYVSTQSAGLIEKITPDGTASIFASGLVNPQGLAFDTHGNLFVADYAAKSV